MTTIENEQAPQPDELKGAEQPKSTCRHCANWAQVKERVRILELLENALAKLESKIKADDFKPSMADYLKLMQLEKDFESEQIKEIKVSWVATAPESESAK